MLDTIYLIAAVIGGTVMVCQFLLTLLGMGDDPSDLADGPGDVGLGDIGDSGYGDLGGDHHTPIGHAADADYQHPDGSWLFGVLSFRTLIAAGAFFGIAGKASLSAGFPRPVSFGVATLVGLAAMYGMYFLMRAISRFTSAGNEQISNATGKLATVYVPIPAAGAGKGKVQLALQNRTVEYQAVTDEDAVLRTGEEVQVTEVVGNDTVAVRRVKETAST